MLNKRYVEGASVLALAVLLAVGSIFVPTSKKTVDVATNESDTESSLYAGTTEYLQDLESLRDTESVTVELEEVESLTATDQLTDEEIEWQSKLIANVAEGKTLNVRAEASTDAEIVGKMEMNSVATVVEAGESWTKISSGNVEGYVANELCIFGLEALEHVKANVDVVAKSTVDGLRVRKEPTTESDSVKTLSEGATLTVAKDAEPVDGWVAVLYKDNVRYVSAEYVEVSYDIPTALTIKEYNKKKNTVKRNGAVYSTANTVYGEGIEYTDDELFLLASLLYCEAGGSSKDYDMQLACAAVVVNCVKSSKFPNSIYGVIYQKNQYGPVSSGKLDRIMSSGRATESDYAAARAALAGEDNTDGALSFQGVSSGYSGVVYGDMVYYKL